MRRIIFLSFFVLLSCTSRHTSTFTFNWDFLSAQNMTDDGITELVFYVDGKEIERRFVNQFSNSSECGSSEHIRKVHYSKGEHKIHLVVRDQIGVVVWDLYVYNNPKQCKFVSLIYD
jgi:hypothetical protein